MNLFNSLRRALAVATLAAATVLPAVPPPASWESAGIQVVVEGTSTLHDWKVESSTATGWFRASPAGVGEGALNVPARSLSGGPNGLNDKMYAALQATKNPAIAFEVAELRLPDAVIAVGQAQNWPVRGKLTIAGNAREIVVPCSVTRPAADRLVIETEVELKMTDYGVKPPGFMGVVKTGDAVVVRVRWTLSASLGPRTEA